MRVIALSTLRSFWSGKSAYADAREPTLAWYRHVLRADWSAPSDVKRDFGTASILRDGRAVFNIAGNKYRLVVWINYPYRGFTYGSSERIRSTTGSTHKRSEDESYGN